MKSDQSDPAPDGTDRSASDGRCVRRAYSSPRLIDFGDVRDVTLGGSPGVGDSGNPGIFKP